MEGDAVAGAVLEPSEPKAGLPYVALIKSDRDAANHHVYFLPIFHTQKLHYLRPRIHV